MKCVEKNVCDYPMCDEISVSHEAGIIEKNPELTVYKTIVMFTSRKAKI